MFENVAKQTKSGVPITNNNMICCGLKSAPVNFVLGEIHDAL